MTKPIKGPKRKNPKKGYEDYDELLLIVEQSDIAAHGGKDSEKYKAIEAELRQRWGREQEDNSPDNQRENRER